MSIILRLLGRYEEGIETLQTILPIMREDYGPENRFVFLTLHELGKTLLADDRAQEALPYLEEACAIAEKLLSREHNIHAVLSIQLADALFETGSAPRAQGLLRDARRVLEQTFGTEGEHRYLKELVRVEDKLSGASSTPTGS